MQKPQLTNVSTLNTMYSDILSNENSFELIEVLVFLLKPCNKWNMKDKRAKYVCRIRTNIKDEASHQDIVVSTISLGAYARIKIFKSITHCNMS